MNLLRTVYLSWIFQVIATNGFGQVIQRSVVEHFTNTSCSICASNNGNIHNAISSQSKVLHISYHPSSPYSNDFFNLQNKTENDDRTRFYGIYGSTPRVVLNGASIPYSTLSNSLAAKASIQTNFTISVLQVKFTNDSFLVKIIIKKIGQDTIGRASLFVGVLEDTINQLTNNGEKFHYNVFRKALTATSGKDVILPVGVGDSVVFNFRFKGQAGWDIKRLHSLGILQKTSKGLINSNISINFENQTAGATSHLLKVSGNFLYPNPVNNGVVFSKAELKELTIYNQFGEKVRYIEIFQGDDPYGIGRLSSGIYIAVYKVKDKVVVQKMIVQ